ncbi:MAG: hypothetical protein WCG80_08045 [Spirochaetales bacterium]
MKKTLTLQVSASQHIPKGKLILHPNDGFDLGLMRVKHEVQLCGEISVQDYLKGESGTRSPAEVDILNECPHQTLQLGASHWKLLGCPPKAVVFYDGERLFIQPLQT